MPTKKKKRTSSRSGKISDKDKTELARLMYLDRGAGLEDMLLEELRPHNAIKNYKQLVKHLEKLKMSAADAFKIIDRFLFSDKNARQNLFKHYVLKDTHYNRTEVNLLHAAVVKHGAKKIFYREDPDKALSAFERLTLYEAPPKIKTFEKDLTTLRKIIGKKRAYNDGAFQKKRLEEAKDRIARKKFKGKR